ncbi:MAG: peptidylprolyl isomerase [Gemmataceae bacterium]|nr:peptidylprolyl isomerase [Gemmataceae bacterium]
MVVVETSKGAIHLELEDEKAPKTVANFLSYVDDKFYDGTIFHRVILGFMVQGGGFTPDMKQKKTKPTVQNESANGLQNLKGAVAMARTSEPHSASSQFFINGSNNHFLDKAQSGDGVGYCVFGNVTQGLEIVETIEKSKTGNKQGMSDVPVETVTIISIKRLQWDLIPRGRA